MQIPFWMLVIDVKLDNFHKVTDILTVTFLFIVCLGGKQLKIPLFLLLAIIPTPHTLLRVAFICKYMLRAFLSITK